MNPYTAEFIGTAILVIIGNGSVANVLMKDTKGHAADLMLITTAWALAVFMGVTIAAPYSGAHLNPAVSIGLATAGKFAWAETIPYILAQMSGAFLGATTVWAFYRNHINRTEDAAAIQGCFCTAPAIKCTSSNFFSEFVATAILILGVLYITNAEATLQETNIPIGLGSVGAIPIAFFVWGLGNALGGTTGYAINPARDLAPRIAHALLPMKHKGESSWAYSWIPVVAPIIAAIAVGAAYSML